MHRFSERGPDLGRASVVARGGLLAGGIALWLGCGGSGVASVDMTSGGEHEADGVAKAMPPSSPAPQEPVQPPQPVHAEPTILRPTLDAIPGVGAAGPPPPPTGSSPSEWGAPDAEAGRPLPQRRPMAAAARPLYQEGLQKIAAGDLQAGQSALERAYRADPRSHEVAFALGVVADRSGQPDRALGYYRKSLQLQPDFERAVDGAVKLYLRAHNPDAAVRFAAPIAEAWVRNLSVQSVYAEALLLAGRVDQAEAVARRALRRDERFVPAMIVLAKCSLRRGRQELSASILEQAAAVSPQHPEIHFMQGQAAEREGQIAKALTHYRKAVEGRPDFAEARTALGIQYMAGGNYGAALSQFTVAARLAPTMPEVHLNLGDAYRANERWTDAKREFDLALRLDASLPEPHFNLGLLYMEAGADYPELTLLDALKRAVSEFNTYRDMKGPQLRAGDPSESYLADVTRQIEREEKRLERERRRQQQASGGG